MSHDERIERAADVYHQTAFTSRQQLVEAIVAAYLGDTVLYESSSTDHMTNSGDDPKDNTCACGAVVGWYRQVWPVEEGDTG